MKFFEKIADNKPKKAKVTVSKNEHKANSPRGQEIQKKFFPKQDRSSAVVQSDTVRVGGKDSRAYHRKGNSQKVERLDGK